MDAKAENIIQIASICIESLGIIIILLGLLFSFFRFFAKFSTQPEKAYTEIRQNLGKTILLGLEILVVADIVGTVMTKTTMEKVLILAVVVAIRIVLGLSIQVEIDGKFPWKKNEKREFSN